MSAVNETVSILRALGVALVLSADAWSETDDKAEKQRILDTLKESPVALKGFLKIMQQEAGGG